MKDKSMAPEVLTVAEAAQLLRMNPKTVYEAVHKGELPALRFGRTIRIHRESLVQLLRAR